MKTKLALVLIFGLAACGDSNSKLGSQIDVMGRAAVNTALISSFSDDLARGSAEDSFNTTDNSDRGSFKSTIAGQLAIYDSLVGGCGDNGLTNRASTDPADGLATGPDRYSLLATVLADDQLYVNGSSAGAESGLCNQYLSAELGVVGVTGLEADCGGRTLNYDVIQTTYSAVAAGAATGVDDGIASDSVTHSDTTFPFFAFSVE